MKADIAFAASAGVLLVILNWFAHECIQVRRASRLRTEPWHTPHR